MKDMTMIPNITLATKRTSAAHIVVPGAKPPEQPATSSTPSPIHDPAETTAAIFDSLRDVRAAFGPKPNKNDLVDTLIEVCIAEGLNTRVRIVRALKHLGLNYRHVAMRLNSGTGTDPNSYRWQVDADRVYSLYEQAA
jgi:hypothetical protein